MVGPHIRGRRLSFERLWRGVIDHHIIEAPFLMSAEARKLHKLASEETASYETPARLVKTNAAAVVEPRLRRTPKMDEAETERSSQTGTPRRQHRQQGTDHTPVRTARRDIDRRPQRPLDLALQRLGRNERRAIVGNHARPQPPLACSAWRLNRPTWPTISSPS